MHTFSFFCLAQVLFRHELLFLTLLTVFMLSTFGKKLSLSVTCSLTNGETTLIKQSSKNPRCQERNDGGTMSVHAH